MTEATELADLLTTASRTGAVCVLDLDGVGAVTLNADQVVQAGSAFKIAVALEVYCQANTGQLDLNEHLRFTAERAPVTDGTIEQAIDLMLRLSDNAASNALLHRVTREPDHDTTGIAWTDSHHGVARRRCRGGRYHRAT